jgi:hypothetical protein
LTTERVSQSFAAPAPLKHTPSTGNEDKYCEFHKQKGHLTDDCFQLKKEIETVVKSGKMSHLLKEIHNNTQRGYEW